MIRLYSLMPDRLNLNGDQANLIILQKRMAWQGIQAEIVPICSPEDMREALAFASHNPQETFVLIGHGSVAAMRTLEPWKAEVRAWIDQLINLGCSGLAVGSGFELLLDDIKRKERVSEFAVAQLREGVQGLGYVNSDAELPLIEVVGAGFVRTLLHGPVLAKNPHLADWFLKRMGVTVKQNDRTKEIDAIVAKVWELEANH